MPNVLNENLDYSRGKTRKGSDSLPTGYTFDAAREMKRNVFVPSRLDGGRNEKTFRSIPECCGLIALLFRPTFSSDYHPSPLLPRALLTSFAMRCGKLLLRVLRITCQAETRETEREKERRRT